MIAKLYHHAKLNMLIIRLLLSVIKMSSWTYKDHMGLTCAINTPVTSFYLYRCLYKELKTRDTDTRRGHIRQFWRFGRGDDGHGRQPCPNVSYRLHFKCYIFFDGIILNIITVDICWFFGGSLQNSGYITFLSQGSALFLIAFMVLHKLLKKRNGAIFNILTLQYGLSCIYLCNI